ncbi:MAG: hypothetical protein EOO38_01480 [Cytophagaceae bacterium]|nr:MAG: hypothetical protein EOO38_01480 [Cytophagaceae bacterium]
MPRITRSQSMSQGTPLDPVPENTPEQMVIRPQTPYYTDRRQRSPQRGFDPQAFYSMLSEPAAVFRPQGARHPQPSQFVTQEGERADPLLFMPDDLEASDFVVLFEAHVPVLRRTSPTPPLEPELLAQIQPTFDARPPRFRPHHSEVTAFVSTPLAQTRIGALILDLALYTWYQLENGLCVMQFPAHADMWLPNDMATHLNQADPSIRAHRSHTWRVLAVERMGRLNDLFLRNDHAPITAIHEHPPWHERRSRNPTFMRPNYRPPSAPGLGQYRHRS